PLSSRAADPIAWRNTLRLVTGQSLARIDHRGLQLHRLTQAILRDQLTPARAAAVRARCEAILGAGDPGPAHDPAAWPLWARLMPHLLAADLAATSDPGLRALASEVHWYLRERGEYSRSRDLASALHRQWRQRPGEDDLDTLRIGHAHAAALIRMGNAVAARELDEDILARRRRLLGDDHFETLRSANTLACDLRGLGQVQAARELDEDTLA